MRPHFAAPPLNTAPQEIFFSSVILRPSIHFVSQQKIFAVKIFCSLLLLCPISPRHKYDLRGDCYSSYYCAVSQQRLFITTRLLSPDWIIPVFVTNIRTRPADGGGGATYCPPSLRASDHPPENWPRFAISCGCKTVQITAAMRCPAIADHCPWSSARGRVHHGTLNTAYSSWT